MESDREINVFFRREDEVIINTTSNAFKLDDTEIYYIFFEQLKRIKESQPDHDDEIILFFAIKNTLLTYFGGKEGNRAKRNRLTSIVTEDDIAAPSISTQKGQNCSLCTERASISHNLWLLVGKTSYFIDSKNCNFRNNLNEFANDGHSFYIVEESGTLKLFDAAMEIFKKLPKNPIKEMLSGKSFEVTNKEVQTFT